MAMKVASPVSALISVTTILPCLTVLIARPFGALMLSGAIALAIASAVFSLLYLSVIVASNLITAQLSAYKLVGDLYEILPLLIRQIKETRGSRESVTR